MKKIKFEIEYTLKKGSLPILWNSISTPLGLSEWFSDGVTVVDNEYTFLWDKNEQSAILLNLKSNSYIRFQWKEDINTDFYFEMKIENIELTGELALFVTDFAEVSEIEETKLWWNHQIEILRRKTGI
ncbi:MAG: START-like domain-containing protein [Paludibacter sp.]|nr:START-like domain-containing protein [Paludibacter sp.]